MKSTILALCIVMYAAETAVAQTDICFTRTERWAPPTQFAIVDVWINHDVAGTTSNGVNELVTSPSMTSADWAQVVRRAISVWNDDGGSRVALRWKGFTTQATITGAIVVRSFEDDPMTESWVASAGTSAPSGTITLGWINLFERTDGSTNTWHSNVDANPGPANNYSLVRTLAHEFGHALHTLEDVGEEQCPFFTTTIMYGVNGYTRLYLWDKEKAQKKHSRRHSLSNLYYRKWTGTSWAAASSLQYPILYRFLSLTYGWANKVAVPTQNIAVTVLGTRIRTFSDGTPANSVTLSPHADHNAVAMAANGAGQIMMVYLTGETYNLPDAKVCYKLSDNNGVTWGAETCPYNDVTGFLYAFHNDVTAAYDPRAKVYIIGLTSFDQNLRFEIIPDVAQSSATPAGRKTFSVRSFHAPAVACRNASYGCRILYAGNNNTQARYWMEAQINLTTGNIEVGNSWFQNVNIYDTPSLIYHAGDNKYWMIIHQDNRYTFPYTLPSSGSSWTSVSSPHYITNSYVLGPALSADSTGVRSWVIRYW